MTVADVIDNTKTKGVLTANDGEKSIYDIRLRKSLLCKYTNNPFEDGINKVVQDR